MRLCIPLRIVVSGNKQCKKEQLLCQNIRVSCSFLHLGFVMCTRQIWYIFFSETKMDPELLRTSPFLFGRILSYGFSTIYFKLSVSFGRWRIRGAVPKPFGLWTHGWCGPLLQDYYEVLGVAKAGRVWGLGVVWHSTMGSFKDGKMGWDHQGWRVIWDLLAVFASWSWIYTYKCKRGQAFWRETRGYRNHANEESWENIFLNMLYLTRNGKHTGDRTNPI